jgi:hypothetical protein
VAKATTTYCQATYCQTNGMGNVDHSFKKGSPQINGFHKSMCMGIKWYKTISETQYLYLTVDHKCPMRYSYWFKDSFNVHGRPCKTLNNSNGKCF